MADPSSVRVAFLGKGGTGKSTVAGTVARLLGRSGRRVLALDLDTVPGLSYSMGMGRIPDAGLPEDVAERRAGKGWSVREDVRAEALVDRYAVKGPDGVLFLQLGKLPGHVRPGCVAAFRHVIEEFRRPGWSLVGDLAAGTRQAFFGWADFATRIAILVEPTTAARLSAIRLARVGTLLPKAKLGLVINKNRGTPASGTVSGLELPVWAVVPYDLEVGAAERAGVALLDRAPASSAVAALAAWTAALLDEGRDS